MTIKSKLEELRAARRKKFKEWYDPDFAQKQFNEGMSSKPAIEVGEPQPKIVTNADRKVHGLELESTLEPVPCDKCGREFTNLKMIPMDKGQGLQYFYHCEDCLLGKTNAKKT